jgi:hypothetical protein
LNKKKRSIPKVVLKQKNLKVEAEEFCFSHHLTQDKDSLSPIRGIKEAMRLEVTEKILLSSGIYWQILLQLRR